MGKHVPVLHIPRQTCEWPHVSVCSSTSTHQMVIHHGNECAPPRRPAHGAYTYKVNGASLVDGPPLELLNLHEEASRTADGKRTFSHAKSAHDPPPPRHWGPPVVAVQREPTCALLPLSWVAPELSPMEQLFLAFRRSIHISETHKWETTGSPLLPTQSFPYPRMG